MRCRRCGCEVENDEFYCVHCSNKIKRAMWTVSLLFTGLVVMLTLIVYTRVKQKDDTEPQYEEVAVREMIPDAELVDSMGNEDGNPYAVNADNITDYGCEQILDYTLYARYEYDENFSFSYPSSIYNQISESEQERDGCFGRVIREVGLGCNDDSYVNFSLTVRIDGRSIEEMTEIVYDYEKGFIYEPQVISNRADESHGMVILKGYTSDECDAGVYNLIHIAPEYIYQMRIYFPTPRTAEEENHINYYLDSMYRLCEFSGHTMQPRSYVEYLIYQDNM